VGGDEAGKQETQENRKEVRTEYGGQMTEDGGRWDEAGKQETQENRKGQGDSISNIQCPISNIQGGMASRKVFSEQSGSAGMPRPTLSEKGQVG
jgi:hypothetical protein